MNYRDLEQVRQIIKSATGLDVAYAYDDLVFPENTAFIIQFDDENLNNLFCYFHEDCNEVDKGKIQESLSAFCQTRKCTLSPKGSFYLEQKGEAVDIHFN